MRQPYSLGLLALLSVTPARAAEVSEEQFVAGLNQDHAAIRALDDDLARAEADRQRAGALDNPRLEVWREQPHANSSLTNWTLSWTPPLDGRFGLGKQAADAGVATARAELALARSRLRRELRRVFADWSLARERCALLAGRHERIAALAEQERQRARVGVESGLTARRLALAAAEARAALREAEAALARAEAEARGWQPGLGADATPAPLALAEPPARVDAGSAPGIQVAEQQLARAQLEARAAGRFWGFPTLQAGVQRLEDGGVVRSGPIVAAAWAIPVLDRSRGARAEAQRRALSAAARVKQAQALSAAEIAGELAAYRTLHTAAGEAREAAAEAERVIEAATAAYRAGEAGLTDLLDALRSAADTRLRELSLRALAKGAQRDLEAALGLPLSDGGVR